MAVVFPLLAAAGLNNLAPEPAHFRALHFCLMGALQRYYLNMRLSPKLWLPPKKLEMSFA